MLNINTAGMDTNAAGVVLSFERPTRKDLDASGEVLLKSQPLAFVEALYDATAHWSTQLDNESLSEARRSSLETRMAEASLLWTAMYSHVSGVDLAIGGYPTQEEVTGVLRWAAAKPTSSELERLRLFNNLPGLEAVEILRTSPKADGEFGVALLMSFPQAVMQVLAGARTALRGARRPEWAIGDLESHKGLETAVVYSLLGPRTVPLGVTFGDMLSLVHQWATHQQSAAVDRLQASGMVD